MPSFKVAHVREQGIDLIIAPLASEFGHKTQVDQYEIIDEIQTRSQSAGLAGKVVPVWDAGGGRMSFIAPQNWHPFFKGLSLQAVWASINKSVTW